MGLTNEELELGFAWLEQRIAAHVGLRGELALSDADIDVTVIAGPALLEDPAATILAWSTRSVLWVVESGNVTETEAHEASNRLALAGASAFGVTLVEAKT